MLQARTHDSSYSSWGHEVIDLTADDEPPAINTNGVWPSPAQEGGWEEPARKRRRVDEEETRDEGLLEVGFPF
ncbi:hypothetical protein IMZ48_43185 [Candidatus Bathyarchaeota archaeon]|nr:hypothetical protein [Candidatus Bathyarchaeota archaeon]